MSAQRLVIEGWHPTTSPNSQRRHWRYVQKRHHIDRDTAWASAMHAGWRFVPGRVRLTITFVCPVNRRRDADNLTARCKGVLDGLKGEFFTDDDTEHLELVVRAETRPGVKQLEIELEAL